MLDHSCTSLMDQVIDIFDKKNYFLFSKQFCRDIVRHTDAVRYYIPLRVMFGLTLIIRDYLQIVVLVPLQRHWLKWEECM